MDIILRRFRKDVSGIFGNLYSSSGNILFVTLEHAYLVDGMYAPKVPAGVYKCVRGTHQLEGQSAPFITFEITGVEGHTGILFHRGNTNQDSSGCVLLGKTTQFNEILSSTVAFNEFMGAQNGINEFNLTVEA